MRKLTCFTEEKQDGKLVKLKSNANYQGLGFKLSGSNVDFEKSDMR